MPSEIDAYLIRLAPNEGDTLTIPNPVIFTNSMTVSAAAGGKLAYTITAETASDPGRHMYLQRTYTGTMGAGKGLTGIEIRSTFNGAAAAATSEVKGGEFKARHTSGNAYDVGTFKGVIGNCDSKSGAKTITSAWAVEGQIDCGVSSTITTAAGVRVAYNEDGTVTNAYGVFVDGTSVWDVGVKITASKTVTGIDIGTCLKAINAATTLTGAAALNAVEFTVTDSTTGSSGYARGLYVNCTASGDKTGTGEHNAVGIDLTPTGNAYIQTPLSMYTGACGSATISNLWGMFLYMDDIGGSATVTDKRGIAIGIDNGDGATTCSFFRLYNHGTASSQITHVFDFPNAGIGAAEKFLHVGCTGGMVEVGDITNGKSCTHGLRCLIAGTTVVIPFYED